METSEIIHDKVDVSQYMDWKVSDKDHKCWAELTCKRGTSRPRVFSEGCRWEGSSKALVQSRWRAQAPLGGLSGRGRSRGRDRARRGWGGASPEWVDCRRTPPRKRTPEPRSSESSPAQSSVGSSVSPLEHTGKLIHVNSSYYWVRRTLSITGNVLLKSLQNFELLQSERQ